MMFVLDATIALELLALGAGTALLMLSGKEGMAARGFGKAIAYLIILVSAFTLFCTAYYGVRYWNQGYFEYPHGMMRGPMGKGSMRDMMDMRNMKDGMGGRRMMKERMMKERMGPGPMPMETEKEPETRP